MMRLFFTQFPLRASATLEEVLEIGKAWIYESPHTKLEKRDLDNLRENGDLVSKDNQKVIIARVEGDNSEFIGLKSIIEGSRGDRFYGILTAAKTSSGLDVAVVVDYDAANAVKYLPDTKKPYVIKKLLSEIGGGRDGDLVVGNKPVRLKAGEEEFVADILRGKVGNMPVVYASATDRRNILVNTEYLSRSLAGIAHVFEEPSREFSFMLRGFMNGSNVYGGAVGVFWPGDIRTFSFMPSVISRERNIEDKIVQEVIFSLRTKRPSRYLTWEFLEGLSREKEIARLRLEREEDSNTLLNLYEESIASKNEEIARFEERVKRLENELRKSRLNSTSGIGLFPDPQVIQLYQGEIRTIVREALQNALRSCNPGKTRRQVILQKLVEIIPVDNERERYVEHIKKILNNYKGMTPEIREGLRELGFEVVDGGKHYKVVMIDDPNGVVGTLPRTPSDWRAGRNGASQLIRDFL